MAGVFSRLVNWLRGSDSRGGRRSTYDAAESQKELKEHWSAADALSAASLNTPEVRATLRQRARLEARNNPTAAGLLSRIAFDLIGTGPRLQLGPMGDAEPTKELTLRYRKIERAFAKWTKEICLAKKLRILHESRLRDGECFAVLKTTRALKGPVKLDVCLIEADQCQSPYDRLLNDAKFVDGIEFDADGNRTKYHFLKQHPGHNWRTSFETEAVHAEAVIHWYRPTRPGQVRGVSEMAPVLNTLAQLRRWGIATLTNMETAAHITGVLESDMPSDTGTAPTFETMDEVDMPRGALLTLPGGWKASSFQANQPNQKFETAKEAYEGDIGRPFHAPFNVVAGNSSKYNYSSGRLDHLNYHSSIWVERDDLQKDGVDRIAYAWFEEAMVTRELGDLFVGLPPFEDWNWDWQWDGFESIDPVKDATAEELELANNTNTLAEICAAKGRHWEDVLAQRAREQARMKELGLGIEPVAARIRTEPTEPKDSQDESRNREKDDAAEDREDEAALAFA